MKLATKLVVAVRARRCRSPGCSSPTVAHAEEHRGEHHEDAKGTKGTTGTPMPPRGARGRTPRRCLRARRRRGSSPTRPASTRTARWCARTPVRVMRPIVDPPRRAPLAPLGAPRVRAPRLLLGLERDPHGLLHRRGLVRRSVPGDREDLRGLRPGQHDRRRGRRARSLLPGVGRRSELLPRHLFALLEAALARTAAPRPQVEA